MPQLRESVIRRGVANESGFSLLEIAIALFVLAMMIGATTGLVVTSLKVGDDSRQRQLAAQLASDELDQAIAAGGTALLSNQGYSGQNGICTGASTPGCPTTPVTRGGVTYTIEQEVAPGNGACSAPSGGEPMELQVTDWVTWKTATGSWWQSSKADVRLSTIVAVPATALNSNDDSLLVKITNQSAQPQSLVTVNVYSGGTLYATVETSDGGCSVFANLPQGNYVVTASAAGDIDSLDDFCVSVAAPQCPTADAPQLWEQPVTFSTGGITTTLSAPYFAPEAVVVPSYSAGQVNSIAASLPLPTNGLPLTQELPLSFYDSANLSSAQDPYVAPYDSNTGGFDVYPWGSYSVVAGSCGTDSIPDGSWATRTPGADGTTVPSSGTLSAGQSGVAANIPLVPVVIFADHTGTQVAGAAITASFASTSGATDANCPSAGSLTAMPTLSMGTTAMETGAVSGRHVIHAELADYVRRDGLVSGGTSTVVSTPATVNLAANVTYRATVTRSDGTAGIGGSVVFYDGSQALNSSPVALGAGGTASFTCTYPACALPPGANSITAVYSGSGTWPGSTSAAVAQEVSGDYVVSALPYGTWKLYATWSGHTPSTTVVVRISTSGVTVFNNGTKVAGVVWPQAVGYPIEVPLS